MVAARVHMHDGVVWYGLDDKSTKCANTNAKSFVSAGRLDSATDIYLTGFSQNAPLVTALYDRYKATSVSLWIGTPMPFMSTSLSAPAAILDNLNVLHSLPSSLGGWHKLDELDFCTAVMQCALMEHTDDVWDDTMFLSHPLYKPLSFISTLDNLTTAKLICMVGDPRWFIDTQKPNKLNKLKAFLGLKYTNTEKILSRKENEITGLSKSAKRCWYTLNSWSGGMAIEDVNLAEPGSFLWHKTRYGTSIVELGMHKATRAFTSFLAGVWLDLVYSDELFVPRYFFENCYDNTVDIEKTSESFKSHMLTVQ